MKKVKIKRKDEVIIGDEFDETDFESLQKIFTEWLELNTNLKQLGGRNLNIPDVFSEAIFCLAYDAIRTNNSAGSYDCVLKSTLEGVQVKSSSILYDCTSFGPTSKWDVLYFMDFVPNGTLDGSIHIYKIDDKDIYDLVLNKEKQETFVMQQKQGRRPRLSIKKSIIESNGLKPDKEINLITGKGIKKED